MSVQNRGEAGERRTHGLMAKIELVRISICGAIKTSNKLRAASKGKSDAQAAAAMPWLSRRSAAWSYRAMKEPYPKQGHNSDAGRW